jgi:hypothetical protein
VVIVNTNLILTIFSTSDEYFGGHVIFSVTAKGTTGSRIEMTDALGGLNHGIK